MSFAENDLQSSDGGYWVAKTHAAAMPEHVLNESIGSWTQNWYL